MRKSLLLFGILILQLNSSCKTHYSTTELENSFTPEQISDLIKIRNFFKEEMCFYTDNDFKTCYEQTPHEYLQATGSGFWTNIDFEKQRKLYDEISQSTFDEIWTFCETTYYPNKIKAKSICSAYDGKYQRYLLDLGKRNPRIAKYAKRIQGSGDFSGLHIQFWEVLENKKAFDLNDPNIQLILAIHYLSLNDQQTRNKELRRRERPKFP